MEYRRVCLSVCLIITTFIVVVVVVITKSKELGARRAAAVAAVHRFVCWLLSSYLSNLDYSLLIPLLLPSSSYLPVSLYP